ncbi:hypothetical protein ACE1CD_32975 [Aerosakkonema sp. BLCC-F183]|uniref:hypothetical protein n=1 Tax=Aerosakkonema sp. BLCC-F183 TaxID=3342834 RepID=UPI0035B9FE0E
MNIFYSQAMIENRKLNYERLRKAGWVAVSIRKITGIERIYSLGWTLQSEICLPFPPRVGDEISIAVFDTKTLENYGLDSGYTESITVKVEAVEIDSISPDEPAYRVEDSLQCLYLYIDVSVTDISALLNNTSA